MRAAAGAPAPALLFQGGIHVTAKTKVYLGLAALLVTIAAAQSLRSPGTPRPPPVEEPKQTLPEQIEPLPQKARKIAAMGMISQCEDILRDQVLRTPSTAEFPGVTTVMTDDRITIDVVGTDILYRSWVDAQNGFGAQVRSRFTCTMDINNMLSVQLTE